MHFRGWGRLLAPCALVTLGLGTGHIAHATQLLEVRPASKADLIRLPGIAPEAGDCGAMRSGDAVQFPADAARAAQLRAAGFQVDVLVDDLESFYRSRMSPTLGGGNFGLYHTVGEAVQAMDDLQALYPSLMTTKTSIGTTLEGRPIYVYKLSDNPNVDENEPEIFFNAYIHAREAITFEVVYGLAQWLLSNYGTDSRAQNILNNREIWIQPVVNPDGVSYNELTDPAGGGMWRKNRRNNGSGAFGVDLNRNFGDHWGWDNDGSSPDPFSDTYRGPSAFSELETQAYRNFVVGRHFSLVLDYHSYSNIHLYAPGYDPVHSSDQEALFALGRYRKVNNNYGVGTAWEMLYPTNGSTNDWQLGDTISKPKILGFVTEVGNGGDGFWPLESRIPALVNENLEANLRMCELADNPYRILPPNVGTVVSADTVGTNFTLTFAQPSPDPDNPAVAWNLIRGTSVSAGTDDVEGTNPSRWDTDGWTVSTARSHSTTHAWFGGSIDFLNSILTSRRAHKVLTGENLVYWTWHNIESGWDYGYVEVSTNGRDFTPIAGTYTTNSDPNGHNLGNGITGNSNGWKQATHSLAAYVGQTIWVRFRYNTDGGTANAGWYVDDVTPSDFFLGEATVASNIPASQYSFTNHPTGTFYFAAQAIDAEGHTAPYSIAKKVVVKQSTAVEGPVAELPWLGLQLQGANPIGESARLRFAVPSEARGGDPIRLDVYDVNGRLVSNLAQGRVGGEATGSGLERASAFVPGRPIDTEWKTAGSASGIYFARLSVGHRSSEQRLVVLN